MSFTIEILILSILIIFQSIFGVGLLLFGTPTFLYFGYSFYETLQLLLPISFTISLIQFLYSKEKDKSFILKFNIFTIPPLIVCLFLILTYENIINIKVFVSIMLILTSAASIVINKFEKIKFENIYKNFFLFLIGLIHGLTNLGGGFLALYANLIVKKNKNLTRHHISYGYLIMALFQLSTIFIFFNKNIDYTNLFYIFLVLILYFPTQFIYKKINKEKFSMIIRIIAICYGFFVLISS